jgi:hypothetical protein
MIKKKEKNTLKRIRRTWEDNIKSVKKKEAMVVLTEVCWFEWDTNHLRIIVNTLMERFWSSIKLKKFFE